MRRALAIVLAAAAIACSPWTGVTYRALVQCVGVGRDLVCDCVPRVPFDMQADPAKWEYVWDAGEAWVQALGPRAVIRLWPSVESEAVTVRCVVYMDEAHRAIGSVDIWMP